MLASSSKEAQAPEGLRIWFRSKLAFASSAGAASVVIFIHSSASCAQADAQGREAATKLALMKGYALSPARLVAGTLEATRRAGCRATAASRRGRGGRVLTRSALAEAPLLGDHLDTHADLQTVTAGQLLALSPCRPRRSYQRRAALLHRMLRRRTRSHWSWHVQSAWTPSSALAGRGTGVHLLLGFPCWERRATPTISC